MIYYKATRPDGSDFYSGTIFCEPGKTVRPHKSEERKICGPGVLHASDVPTETLIGGLWPCKLFEVTGKPHVGFGDTHPHKGGFLQLKVVKELPAWQVFGPQGKEVAALIERAGQPGFWTNERLVASWDAAWYAAWDAAWSAARDAARDAAGYAARSAARDAAGYAARSAARYAARSAARSAAAALVVKDLISEEHFNRLYDSWKRIEAAG